jgi:hypothetical protein
MLNKHFLKYINFVFCITYAAMMQVLFLKKYTGFTTCTMALTKSCKLFF